MENKYSNMYRLQSSSVGSEYSLRQAPIKRVLISGVGKIEFNPDESQYIYFSRTNKHHVYYIFNKVLKIIVDSLNSLNHLKIYKTLGLPNELDESSFYIAASSDVLKRTQDFFRNFLSPLTVEMVTLKYLNTFSRLFETCAVINKQKSKELVPEISDTRNFGGAYGINDAWLGLLKSCLVSTASSSLSVENFFEFLKENTYRSSSCRKTLKGLLNSNPRFFDCLEDFTYKELENPEFKDRNNVNKMVASVMDIYGKGLYNPALEISQTDIRRVTKKLKNEIEQERE